MSDPLCYIKFTVVSEVKLQRLMTVVAELSERKQSEDWKDVFYWKKFFNSEELKHFTELSESQMQEWTEFWNETPVEMRLGIDMPTPGWTFESMIDAIYHGDYELINVKLIQDNAALLEIEPRGWPYGGLEPLKALVRCFNHIILGFQTGDQPFVNGDPLRPIWNPST